MIKAIIFDWGDTLASAALDRYFPAGRVRKKFKLDEKTIKQCLEMLDKAKTPFTPRTIKQEKQVISEFWSQVAKKINIKNPDLFVDYVLKWAFEDYVPTLFSNVLETIQCLFEQKYCLVVLSNGWPKRILEIKKSKVGKYFNKILVSSIIRAEKPDIRAYKIALKEIGIPANQILMVDNKDQYLVPAHKLGMQVLYLDKIDFNPNSQFSRIKDISELIDYLEKNDSKKS